jgi:hypothetical protein
MTFISVALTANFSFLELSFKNAPGAQGIKLTSLA